MSTPRRAAGWTRVSTLARLRFVAAVVGLLWVSAHFGAESIGTDDRAIALASRNGRPDAVVPRPAVLPEPWGLATQAVVGAVLFAVAAAAWQRRAAPPEA